MSNFRVGQRVVCKNADNANRPDPNYDCIGYAYVVQDCIYTIIEIEDTDWLMFSETGEGTLYHYVDFEPLELDYDFVEEVIKQVQPVKEKLCSMIKKSTEYERDLLNVSRVTGLSKSEVSKQIDKYKYSRLKFVCSFYLITLRFPTMYEDIFFKNNIHKLHWIKNI